MVRKEPNQTFYDIGGSVNLTCSAGMLYDIEWYRLNSTESLKKEKLKSQDDYEIIKLYKVLRLKNMYEQNVTYKCQIIRHPLNYRSNKFVNIQLKGNTINFMKSIQCISSPPNFGLLLNFNFAFLFICVMYKKFWKYKFCDS